MKYLLTVAGIQTYRCEILTDRWREGSCCWRRSTGSGGGGGGGSGGEGGGQGGGQRGQTGVI